jgi:hypothetical protein
MWWAPNNARKWQIGFNSALKGLKKASVYLQSRFTADAQLAGRRILQNDLTTYIQYMTSLRFRAGSRRSYDVHGGWISFETDRTPPQTTLPYFPAYKTHRPIRRTVIFSLEILEKNYECILILVIYWKKTGWLHILLQKSKPFRSSEARSHDVEANFTISR